MEIEAPAEWIGRNVRELDVRMQHKINVIGVRTGNDILPLISADRAFNEREHIIVAGAQKDILKMCHKK
jgi:K+/H+ antiporter YhaU regulatory subunit KhtT